MVLREREKSRVQRGGCWRCCWSQEGEEGAEEGTGRLVRGLDRGWAREENRGTAFLPFKPSPVNFGRAPCIAAYRLPSPKSSLSTTTSPQVSLPALPPPAARQCCLRCCRCLRCPHKSYEARNRLRVLIEMGCNPAG